NTCSYNTLGMLLFFIIHVGMDRILRLWNPYVPHKPTGLLRGHASPIIYIAISEEDRRIFSVSTDKCVKVWDVVEQNCLVTVNPKMHKIKGEIMACIYSQQQRALVITTDHISVLGISRRIKVVDEISVTHTEPVTCCAYNPSFGHVITCSEGSVVKLWDFESGTFMFEFNKAHHDTAITSITFDSTGRRLITSGRDGAVRIWNYNNGHCLKSLEQVSDNEVSDNEVSDCVYVEINNNRFIIAVGWDQRINIFSDDTDDFHLVQHPHPHWPDDLRRGHTDDIVAVTFGRPNMLATVSYDGCIIVWNVISGHSISRIPYPNIETDSESHDDDCDKTTVNKLAFLENRFLDKLNATLIAGCSDGTAIFWNIKQVKAHARWRATQRKSGLSSMVLTGDCQLLYVGDTLGFISIWDVETYALRPVGKISADTNCPKWSTPPTQIATWRCHVQPITCIGVIQSHELVITSSVDYTARLWTNTGQFIGTYGQSNPWDIYDPDTWQHPMVPPEVLLDPKSLPEHPVID
uniref:Uncharacterized protein n=1 Tax=Ciona savignyi TaxID=51511 RepID=H2Z5G4_CIOSA